MPQQELGRLKEVSLHDVFDDEPRDFTPWLYENLDLLGDAINLDLTPVEKEGAVGTLSVDIVAESALGQVVIENQLGKSDHGHLGQLLSYAAGREARFLVWIAPSFKEEHQNALVWLNRWMPEDIEVYAVEVRLIRINDSPPAPVFDVVVSPDAPSRKAESLNAPEQSNEESARRRAFFERIVDDARARDINMFRANRSAAKSKSFPCNADDPYIKYWIDLSGSRENGITVKLYIGTKDRDRNSHIVGALESQNAEIEARLGFNPEYSIPQNRQRYGSVSRRWNASIWDDEDTLEEHRRKILDTIEGFQKVLDHRVIDIIENLDSEQADGVDFSLNGDGLD